MQAATLRPNRILFSTVLALLLAAGFWLRWRYSQVISLHVDEFTTMWAATLVQENNVPRTPAGVLYTRGLLNTYIEALFFTLFGRSYTVGRFVSILFGLAAVGATAWIGRRAWNPRVGLLAAAGLALLPEAVVWGARARFYSQLQFFALLTVWAAYAAVTADTADRRGERRRLSLFALFFLLALFSQEETLLLYPSILLAMVLWRGWRYLLRPDVLAVQAVIIAGMIARYLIEVLGQPGYFETIQANRPYVGLVFDPVGAWRAYGPLFVDSTHLPWTLLGLVGIGAALAALASRERRVNRLAGFHQATLFFALQLAAVVTIIFLLVGTSWREARYLYFVQPLWLLLGAAGAIWLVDRIICTERVRWFATALLLCAALLLFWPAAQQTLGQQVEGYDLVLDAVAAQRGTDDLVLSPQPPACALVLGPCDGYAIQRGYEEFVILQDGQLVDRWAGTPLISEISQLDALISGGAPVWLVTDSFRLATRYDENYLRTIVEQFDIVQQERGVLALRADGRRSLPEPVEIVVFDEPLTFGPLTLTGYEQGVATAGEVLPITLLWTSNATVATQYNTSLRLVAQDGTTIAQQDGPPAHGIIPTTLIFDQPVPDFKQPAIPADAVPGDYRLELVVYDVATVTPLTAPQVIGTVPVASP